jgi:hypothetical protein
VWLKRQAPVVTWGPRAQALRLKTKGEARRVVARLDRFGPLEIETIDPNSA